MRRLRDPAWRAVAVMFLTAVAALCAPAASTAAGPRVTVIGDSILTAVLWNSAPLSILTAGYDVRMDVGICRTLTGTSCPFDGERVPTVLDVVHADGSGLGPTVVVEAGYNDPAAASVKASLRAFRRCSRPASSASSGSTCTSGSHSTSA